MSVLSKLIGTTVKTTTGSRTPRERARRAAEIRRIDKGTANWLRAGGWNPRKDR
jgi:hypothetical protein